MGDYSQFLIYIGLRAVGQRLPKLTSLARIYICTILCCITLYCYVYVCIYSSLQAAQCRQPSFKILSGYNFLSGKPNSLCCEWVTNWFTLFKPCFRLLSLIWDSNVICQSTEWGARTQREWLICHQSQLDADPWDRMWRETFCRLIKAVIYLEQISTTFLGHSIRLNIHERFFPLVWRMKAGGQLIFNKSRGMRLWHSWKLSWLYFLHQHNQPLNHHNHHDQRYHLHAYQNKPNQHGCHLCSLITSVLRKPRYGWTTQLRVWIPRNLALMSVRITSGLCLIWKCQITSGDSNYFGNLKSVRFYELFFWHNMQTSSIQPTFIFWYVKIVSFLSLCHGYRNRWPDRGDRGSNHSFALTTHCDRHDFS